MFRMFILNPSSGVPPYLQIKDQIKTQIAMGHLVPGEDLPRIRKLAKDLVVNPSTIVRAYRELEYEDLIASKAGSGVFVTDHGLALTDQAIEERVRDFCRRAVVEARNLKLSTARVLSIFTEVLHEMETGVSADTDEADALMDRHASGSPEGDR